MCKLEEQKEGALYGESGRLMKWAQTERNIVKYVLSFALSYVCVLFPSTPLCASVVVVIIFPSF